MNDCQLTVAPFFQCCCKCVYHLKDKYRCTEENHKRGICFQQKGWVCAPPDADFVESDWPEHSCGCELYTTKEDLEKEDKDYEEWFFDQLNKI